MKKIINKYMLLAVATCLFSACSDDDDNYTPGEWDANSNYAEIYFPKTSVTEELEPTAPCEATIQVMRRNVGSAITVPMKLLSNTDDVFSVSDAVFAAGDSVADVTITFPNANVGSAYRVQFQPDGADYISSYSQNASFSYTVTRIKWNYIGNCLINDWFITGVFLEKEIYQRDDQPSIYRIVNPYSEISEAGSEFLFLQILKKGDTVLGQTVSTSDLVYWYSSDSKAFVNTGYWHGNYGAYIYACFPGRFTSLSDPENWEYSYVGMRDENGNPGQILLAPYYYMDGVGGWNYTQTEPGEESDGGIEILMPGFEKPEIPVIYQADICSEDFSWEEVYEGQFTSEITGNSSVVALMKGTCENTTDDCDKTFAANYGTAYKLVDPYADGYSIYFCVNNDGKVVMPKFVDEGGETYTIQPTGLKALTTDIYAVLNPKASSFTEKIVTLNITFQNEDGSIVYGTTDEVISNITWTSLGMAQYTEDFMTTFFGVENLTYEVEVQERDDMPGVYRLVNPYGAAYPYNEEGDYDTSKDYYMTINCQDPIGCYIEYSPTGMNWGYGAFAMYSLAGYYLSRGNSLEAIKGAGYCGTLENGTITFPAETLLISMAEYNDGALYKANSNGAFKVVLPSANGGEVAAPMKSIRPRSTKSIGSQTTYKLGREFVGTPVNIKKLIAPIKMF